MKYTDNPAKRLHAILSSALSKNKGEQAVKVWASVFGIEDEDPKPKVFYYLGLLHHLTYDIEERIQRLPDINTNLYLRAMPDIRDALAPMRFDQSFQNTADRHLSAGTLTVLEFCANELGKHHHEDPIPPESLEELRTDITGLREEIGNADLDEDLRMVLLDLSTMMLRAIDEYDIRGAAGLRDNGTVDRQDSRGEIKEKRPEIIFDDIQRQEPLPEPQLI